MLVSAILFLSPVLSRVSHITSLTPVCYICPSEPVTTLPVYLFSKYLFGITMTYEDCHIGKCPDKVLLNILGFIPHKSLISVCSRVCKKWKTLSQDSRLWSFVSLRSEVSGIYIPSIEFLVQLIRNR